MAENGSLKIQQHRAITALLSERTIQEAARKAEVSERNLHRWLKLPAFQQALQEARQEVSKHTLARLQQVTVKSVDTLETVMENEETPAASRVAAAKAVLDLTLGRVVLYP